MILLATEGTAGVIDINGTVIVEVLTFLLMLAVLARYVYPEIVKVAEARQRAIAEQLHEAEKAKADAEGRPAGQGARALRRPPGRSSPEQPHHRDRAARGAGGRAAIRAGRRGNQPRAAVDRVGPGRRSG